MSFYRRRPEKTDVVYLAEENGQDIPVALDYVRYSSQKRPSEDLVSFQSPLQS